MQQSQFWLYGVPPNFRGLFQLSVISYQLSDDYLFKPAWELIPSLIAKVGSSRLNISEC
jgi:hypothetical protein